jgi:dTDP-D-glucose 4,6-dehydratase
VHGDGSSERDFLYVQDVANAFDYLLHYGEPNEFYNIGANEGITILDLAKKIVKIMKNTNGNEMDYIEYFPGRILDDKRYKIDSSKIRSTGWKEQIDFDQGLKLAIDWYIANPNHWPQVDFALSPHPDIGGMDIDNNV